MSRMGLYIPNFDWIKAPQSSKNTDLAIQCSPNPAHTYTTIQFELQQTTKVQIYLFDALGQLVQTTALLNEWTGGQHQYPLNVSHLASGCYQVVVETAHGMEYQSLVVQNR